MNEIVVKRRLAEATQKLVKCNDPASGMAHMAGVLGALGDLLSGWTGEVVRVSVTAEGQPEALTMTKPPAGH